MNTAYKSTLISYCVEIILANVIAKQTRQLEKKSLKYTLNVHLRTRKDYLKNTNHIGSFITDVYI